MRACSGRGTTLHIVSPLNSRRWTTRNACGRGLESMFDNSTVPERGTPGLTRRSFQNSGPRQPDPGSQPAGIRPSTQRALAPCALSESTLTLGARAAREISQYEDGTWNVKAIS